MDRPDYSVLVVDLDETLVATDTLLESVLLYMRSHPFRIFFTIFWLLKGKSYFKERLAQRVRPDAARLPYRREILEYIGRAKEAGVTVVLATASNVRIAREIAQHLGLFTDVLASDAEVNLSGRRKLGAVLALTGENPFAYIGDAPVDAPVWEAAATAVVVDPPEKLLRRLRGHPDLEVIRSGRKEGRLKTWIKVLRVHQWAKNFLVFVPAVMAHRIFEPVIVTNLLLAFLSLSFSASAVYLLNDLLDLESDRQHLRKKYRPLASGAFSLSTAMWLIPLFFAVSYSLALLCLPFQFFLFLLVYLTITSLYSIYLKQLIIVDVILLAALYTLRVIIGAIAVEILVSSWLLAFSMFFFLSLALMKRYSELLAMHEDVGQVPGRGYFRYDAETIMASGIASGQLSLLVFALFMSGAHMRELYGEPQLLWFVLPVLFYWIIRMWMIAHRGDMHEDPIVFAIKDRASYIALLIIAAIIYAASQKFGANFPVSFLEP